MRTSRIAVVVPPIAKGGIVVALAGAAVFGCNHPRRRGVLIDRYKAADCIPPLTEPKYVRPATREWEYHLTTRRGDDITVVGAQMPGGQIVLKFNKTGESVVAAWAGDYVYPADVRFDRTTERLYVKADGLAGGLRRQTWLFEFDIGRRQEAARMLVDPDALPPECGT